MSTTLSINGSVVGRSGARLTLGELTLSTDGDDRLTWTEHRLHAGTGSWSAGGKVVAAVDGTTRFIGQTVSATPTPAGRGCIDVSYTALGLRHLICQAFIEGPDGTGAMTWNLNPEDPEYSRSLAGKTVGEILKSILDQHQTALTALGLADPCYDVAELDALVVVPPSAVTLAGRLMDSIADLVSEWCPKFTAYPDSSDGLFHFRNTLTLSTLTLTLDSDPIVLEGLSKTHSESYSRVVVRGGPDVRGAYLSLADGTLVAGWTAPQQAAWSITDYWNPRGSASSGAVTAQSSTTLTVTPDDATEAWGTTHYWADKGGQVYAYDPAATGITFQEFALITANTVKAAGASGTLTVAPPWSNTGYTRYQVRGDLSEQSLVWRKFTIGPVDGDGHNYVADHLVRTMPHSMPWSPADGVLVQTTQAVGVVCWSSNNLPPFMEFPWPLELLLPDGTDPGYIVFREPVCKAYSTQAQLVAGGAAISAPGDVKVLVPYSVGALTAACPADVSGAPQYEGTSHTVDAIDRTLYRDYRDWIDRRDAPAMAELARELLDSVKDTVIEGQLLYYGKYSAALTMGKALNLAAATVTTGWESLAAPIRSVTLGYQDHSAIWTTRVEFSTRRKPFTGDRLYLPVAWGSTAQLNPAASLGEGYDPGAGLVEGTMRGQLGRAIAGNAETAAAMEGLQPTTEGPTGDGGYSPEGPRRQGTTQAEQVAKDADREFKRGTDAMDAEMKRVTRRGRKEDEDEGMKRLRGDYDS